MTLSGHRVTQPKGELLRASEESAKRNDGIGTTGSEQMSGTERMSGAEKNRRDEWSRGDGG